MKLLKTIGKLILLIFIALIVSTLSMRIKMGTDSSESATIGIQTKRGFPIAYATTAPGLAWTQYDGLRFKLNTLAWVLIFTGIKSGMRQIRKRSSIKKAQLKVSPEVDQRS